MRDVLVDKMVTTRKEHACFGCGDEYPAGSKMQYEKSVQDCGICRFYLCEICNEYVNERIGQDDEFNFGELKKNDPEVWGAIHAVIKGVVK